MRIVSKNVCIKRPNNKYALYKMLNHKASVRNPVREGLLFSTINRMKIDGLNNLDKLNVSIVDVNKFALYTQLKIYVGKPHKNYWKKYNISFKKNF